MHQIYSLRNKSMYFLRNHQWMSENKYYLLWMLFPLVHRCINVLFPMEFFLCKTFQLEMILCSTCQICNLHLSFMFFQSMTNVLSYLLYVAVLEIQISSVQIWNSITRNHPIFHIGMFLSSLRHFIFSWYYTHYFPH